MFTWLTDPFVRLFSYIGRKTMQGIIGTLFAVAFTPLVRVIKAFVAPTLASTPLDPAQLAIIGGLVGDLLQNVAPTYAQMGVYTAQQQQDIVEGIKDIIIALMFEYKLAVDTPDLGRLLKAVFA
jgi:hypothetical protein